MSKRALERLESHLTPGDSEKSIPKRNLPLRERRDDHSPGSTDHENSDVDEDQLTCMDSIDPVEVLILMAVMSLPAAKASSEKADPPS